MAAACYPEAQARVQAQLDEVVGRNRSELPSLHSFEAKLNTTTLTVPTFDDRKLLTEVEAFVLEVFRWRPAAVLGKYHWKDRNNSRPKLLKFS